MLILCRCSRVAPPDVSLTAMIAQSEAMTILADASKLARTALGELCRLDRVRRLVCDGQPPGGLARSIEAAGVEFVLTRK